ncbi:MAG: hypothetical protein COZ29_02990 [Candidatus Moranbacteria bacterium CG_4_10_14_3_um_filter_45_9]|nr:MAG: hypothetical protein AUK19_00515 [Candidatus Moranbacteria bacterium CG2_30_45_14]PIX89873.1 MAG: hypothetical protein COZ29_02990 [Candidatus Moranbacteria bacterium CG_4_10_14_3_um_filter_45_9]PJA85443.1 MAG: hypothetical protein CO143_01640 [Candidatus Moranbacteria bacterium CG_4_9_14_3_um_filter_45_14]
MNNPFSKDNHFRIVEKTGIVLVTMSVIIFLLTFYPVVKEELKYQFLPKHNNASVVTREEASRQIQTGEKTGSDIIYPVDEGFGIVIPKLSANAKVIPDVDWMNEAVYQRALTRGVAQARGTALPGEAGNVFLFAHSGVDFYKAVRYNAQFYLLNKLVIGDEIDLFYNKQKFTYRVSGKKTVSPENVEYLTGDREEKTLTLMTCTPAGTTLERLIVVADQVESD